jgi:exo-1,4-beta-D-glucosaminidase
MEMSSNRRALRHTAGTLLLLGASLALACAPAPEEEVGRVIALREGWAILAAAEVAADGAAISMAGFEASGWTPTDVPSTVIAALARAGAVPDPYFGKNLEAISGDRFAGAWWYRTELTLDEPLPPTARLVFEGLNYSAEVWLNGQQVAGREELVGAFRMFDLDVAPYLTAGANALAVLVYPPEPGDPTLGFVDWNPTPPDRNMGLWRGVELRLAGEVALGEIFVRSDLDLDSLDRASLTVSGELRNSSDRQVTAVVRGEIGEGISVREELEIAAGETRPVELSGERFAQLIIDQPRLWWPNGLGEPELYTLELSVRVDGRVADRRQVTFGIRHVEDYITEDGHRGYAVNGKKVLIRGGGWVDDMLLADDDQRLEDQIRYVKHMNLNTIRLEGFWGSSHELFDLADRHGILVMVGWSCQWEWEEYLGGPVDEFGGIDSPAEMELVTRSLRDQVIWLRNHPSVLVWVLASDMLPRPELESRYRTALAEVDPTRPALATCARGISEVSGDSGVKMSGPYDWVPPSYWYLDRERGGAFGFNTETGPGPQPPPAASIRRMMPQENWWPIDEMWNFHSGRNQFNTIDRYKAALDARYGPSAELEEFARKAQVANYEGMRAMFEAFSIRRPATTGIIQWMLNSAWPEMYWQLYDHYLVPNGAFYGARDASRPVNIAFDYEDRGVVVVNDAVTALAGVTAAVRIFDLESQVIFEESRPVDVGAEAMVELLTVPAVSPAGGAYFIDARLTGDDGELLASSLYWLSKREDELDWEGTLWFVTPTKRYADFTGLADLPRVELEVEHRFAATTGGHALEVTLANPGDKLAFFVELEVVGAESGRLAAPVLWSDNYLSLMPGETRRVSAEVPAHALAGEEPLLRYGGYNVDGS